MCQSVYKQNLLTNNRKERWHFHIYVFLELKDITDVIADCTQTLINKHKHTDKQMTR